VLLLNGSTSKKFQHNIVELYTFVKSIGGDLLPRILTAPEGLETGRDVSPEDFFSYLYARGNAHNRYMIYGYSARGQDIFMVDKMVFALRRLTVPLDDRAFPPHVKSAMTYRERLTEEPNHYPDLGLPLDAVIKDTENSSTRVAALNFNLTAFTPDDFTQARGSDSADGGLNSIWDCYKRIVHGLEYINIKQIEHNDMQHSKE
jgi:hypothetical protein